MEGVKEGRILSGDRGLRHESMRNWKTKMEPEMVLKKEISCSILIFLGN